MFQDSGLSRATDSEPDGTLPSQQYFSVQCQPRNSMPNEPKNFGKNQNEESLERELAYLHQEMENIRLECDRLINKRVSSERRAAQQVGLFNKNCQKWLFFAKNAIFGSKFSIFATKILFLTKNPIFVGSSSLKYYGHAKPVFYE